VRRVFRGFLLPLRGAVTPPPSDQLDYSAIGGAQLDQDRHGCLIYGFANIHLRPVNKVEACDDSDFSERQFGFGKDPLTG